jgi:hypothetical protein
MDDPAQAKDEWERKQAIAGAMVDFLEGWVVRELCLRFRIMAEAVYSETLEQRLLGVLLDEDSPQSLQAIASKCGVSRALMLPERRLRKVIERMEKSGIVSRSGPEDKPRYSLNRGSLTCQLLRKVFGKPKLGEGLVAASLRESIGPHLGE